MDTIACEYIVYQTEKGENGTVHIQGYVYFKEAKTMKRIKKDLARAHLMRANGSHASNRDYCTKIKTRVINGITKERGTLPTQGVPTNWPDMLADVRKGLTPSQMIVKYEGAYGRAKRVLEEYRLDLIPARTQHTIVHV